MVLDTIRRIEAQKKRENKHPYYALLVKDNPFKNVEALCSWDKFNDILKELEDWGVIRIGRTMNDTYITEVEFSDMESSL